MKNLKDYQYITVPIGDLAKVTKFVLGTGQSVFFLGPPGVGKTTVAEEIGREGGYEQVIMFNPQNWESCDVKYPYMLDKIEGEDVRRSGFAINQIIPKYGTKLLIILDEFNTALDYTQPMWNAILYEKRIGDYRMNPDTTDVIATGNRLHDGVSAVNETGVQQKDRLTTINVEPNHDHLIKHAIENKWAHHIISFLRNHPECLLPWSEENQDYGGLNPNDIAGGCSPRSLEAVSRMILKSDNLAESFNRHNVWREYLDKLIHGTIGKIAASKFKTHLELLDAEIKIDEILKDPKGADLPDDQRFMGLTFAVVQALIAIVNKDNFEKLATYTSRLSPTFTNAFMTESLNRHEDLRSTQVGYNFLLQKHDTL